LQVVFANNSQKHLLAGISPRFPLTIIVVSARQSVHLQSRMRDVRGDFLEANLVIIDFLRHHWLFGVLEEAQLKAISEEFLTKTYKTGQHIFYQSDPAAYLYVILKGEVSIETTSEGGKVIKITHLADADIFGELALIDNGLRSAGALAIKTTEIVCLPKAIFQRILERNPFFSQKLLIVLAERLRDTNVQVESLVTLSLLQRTAKLLLQLQLREGDHLNITQKQLSERLFASREKVNAKLKILERMRAIEIRRGSIDILDLEILEGLTTLG